jgi:hypothetical protein
MTLGRSPGDAAAARRGRPATDPVGPGPRDAGDQFRGYRDELLTHQSPGSWRPCSGAGHQQRAVCDGASVTYQPQVGEQQVGLDASTPTSLDGRQTFMNLPNGAGTQSVFDLLETPRPTKDGGGARHRHRRCGWPASTPRLSRTSLAEAGSIELAAQMSDLVDVDFAKAISDFQNNQTALSAAMKTYSQISKMSLFDYL